jgi:hypothetical protein
MAATAPPSESGVICRRFRCIPVDPRVLVEVEYFGLDESGEDS